MAPSPSPALSTMISIRTFQSSASFRVCFVFTAGDIKFIFTKQDSHSTSTSYRKDATQNGRASEESKTSMISKELVAQGASQTNRERDVCRA